MAACYQKCHLSRWLGSPTELASTVTHPIKRVKEEPSSDSKVLILSLKPLTISDLDYEDVCIPCTQTDHYTASDAESQAKFDDDEPYKSDGGLRALILCTRQAHAGLGKWDADAKHACWNKKYGAMKAEEAVGVYIILFSSDGKAYWRVQGSCMRSGAQLLMTTLSIRRWCRTMIGTCTASLFARGEHLK